MKLSEQFAAQAQSDSRTAPSTPSTEHSSTGTSHPPSSGHSVFVPGDRVRIRGENKIMTVVRVMDETWVAVKGGPYVGHAITAGSLEKVGD